MRPHKSVPGLLAETVFQKKYPNTTWSTCSEDIKQRVLDDGDTLCKVYNLKIKNSVKVIKDIRHKPLPGYRKIVMVTAPSLIPFQSTDFHFYAQNKILSENLYNMKLIRYMNNAPSVYSNEYIRLNINAFASNLELFRYRQMGYDVSKILKTRDDKLKRAKYNLSIHVEMFPEYMLEFIIDPYWMLDISSKKEAHKRIEKLKQSFSDNQKILKTLNGIEKAIKFNKRVSKNKLVGIWSHKLGWGTVPLNTDGNGKIIFNPTHALKHHGGYNYTNVCTVFQVLRGYGTTSPWFNIKKFNNHIHK
jgi:hypothetical protein